MSVEQRCTIDKVEKCLEQYNVKDWSDQDIAGLLHLIEKYSQEVNSNTNSLCIDANHVETLNTEPYQRDNVELVIKVLNRIRSFILSKVEFGTLDEPTHVHGENNCKVNVKEDRSTAQETYEKYNNNNNKNNKNIAHTDKKQEQKLVEAPVYSLDSFLYREEDINDLVQRKLVCRDYCTMCGSTDIAPTEFITHSFSQDELIYLSCYLLPSLLACVDDNDAIKGNCGEDRGQVIVDVGSRFGVVLWALAKAYRVEFFSHTHLKKIVGIEKDDRFVNIQNAIRNRFFSTRYLNFKENTRIKVESNDNKSSLERTKQETEKSRKVEQRALLDIDIMHINCFDAEGIAILSAADVIILHNVFEYFCNSASEHLQCWLKLRACVHHPGQLLVCAPSLHETFSSFTYSTLRECNIITETNEQSNTNPSLLVEETETYCNQIDHARVNKKRRRDESSMLSVEDDQIAHEETNNNVNMKLDDVNNIIDEWISSYVEEVDVSEIAEAFLVYHNSNKEHIDEHEHHIYDNNIDKNGDNNTNDDVFDDDVVDDDELVEHVNNIHVYRVK